MEQKINEMNYETMTFESLAHQCSKDSDGKLDEVALLNLFTHVNKVVKKSPKSVKQQIEYLSMYCFNKSGYTLNQTDLESRLAYLFLFENNNKNN